MTTCTLYCRRPLDQPGDILSADTGGGHCWGCIIEIEDGEPAPADLGQRHLRIWLEARAEAGLYGWPTGADRLLTGSAGQWKMTETPLVEMIRDRWRKHDQSVDTAVDLNPRPR